MTQALRALALVMTVLMLSSLAQAAPQNGSQNAQGPQGVPPAGAQNGGPNSQGSPAGGPPPGGGPREACRADAQTFCKGIQPGGGRIKDCLEDHYKQISDACYNALKNAPPGPPPGAGHSGGQGGGGKQGNGGPPPQSKDGPNDASDNGPPSRD